MAELPLNYLRKFTVSRKPARPLGPGRMGTARSLAQAGMLRNPLYFRQKLGPETAGEKCSGKEN